MKAATILAAGVTTGYITSTVQLSPGPYNAFRRLREWFVVKTIRHPSKVYTLASCGWCLSTWIAIPTLLAFAGAWHDKPSLPDAIVSWGCVSAISAIYRAHAND